nr:PQQ-binding-like beta-propeller repeat protein [Pyrinomonadaceae bacterium]
MIKGRLFDNHRRMIVRTFYVSRCKTLGFSLLAFFMWQDVLPFPLSKAQNQITLTRPLTVRWQYPSDRTLNLTPAVENDHIYLPLAGGALVSLRVDGQFTWQTETGGDFSAAPITDERAVYVASEIKAPLDALPQRATGLLRALGRASGVTLWMSALQKPLRGTLASNRHMIFGGGEDGSLYAILKNTGQVA